MRGADLGRIGLGEIHVAWAAKVIGPEGLSGWRAQRKMESRRGKSGGGGP